MRLKFISCGGTIASTSGEHGTATDSSKNAAYLISRVCEAYPSLLGGGSNPVDISCTDQLNQDSTDIGAAHWSHLVDVIVDSYDDNDAFIISHGTNTIAYTACALSFALGRLGKPIILTGAQIPIGVEGSDALANLSNAIRVAMLAVDAEEGDVSIPGVCVVFGSHVIPGVRAKKVTEYEIEAFKTFNSSPIGRIRADEIRFDRREIAEYRRFLEPIARVADDLEISSDFTARVASLTVLPDTPPEVIKCLVQAEFKGIVLRAFGAGDLPESILSGLQSAKKRGVPVVITTQCPDGISSLELNEVGQRALRYDVIRAWDMSMEAMTTKLRWMLSRGDSASNIRNMFGDSIRGEVLPAYRNSNLNESAPRWWRWTRH